jgi:hypothetical protein
MKKLNSILCLTLFLFLATNAAFANSTAISNFNSSSVEEAEIYTSFAEIDEIVSYIGANENITYSDLEATDFSLSALSSNSALALFPDEEGDNRFYFNKQTAFFMGCVFGMLGVLAVAIVNNGNSSVVNNSIWGCVTSGCVSGGAVIAFYAYFFLILESSYFYY